MKGLLPGLILAVAVALVARGVHALLPAAIGKPLGAVIIAIAIGLAVGNLIKLPPRYSPGISLAQRLVLRLAIVLLGAGLSFQMAARIGGQAVVMIVVLMGLALTTSHLLARRLGAPRRLATLIGVGTAVCGNSAISAVSPVIGASEEETAFAIATNTLFGTLAVFSYPLIGHALDLPQVDFGAWCGLAVNDTSQVVAAASAFGETASQLAIVVKLTRNALMGPLILLIGLTLGRRRDSAQGARSWPRLLSESLPWFVLGFLAMAVLNSLGWLPSQLIEALKSISQFLILVALAAVGIGTRWEAMRRIGWVPLGVGLATAIAVSITGLWWIRTFGPPSL